MAYRSSIGARSYRFADLKDLLAKASPPRSGDSLAGIAAHSAQERMAARLALADVPLSRFLEEPVIAYEEDEVTRLILDSHAAAAFAPIASATVGEFRNWLLADSTDEAALTNVARGITPEMAAAVSKLMRNQDLILAAKKCRVVTRFRNTIGLPGRLAVRLQPNHPTDDPHGVAASILDGLLYGAGDAVIGINPATDRLTTIVELLHSVDDLRVRYEIPTQSCVLTHVTNSIAAVEQGAPVDLVFQSIAGTQAANTNFGVSLALLREAHDAVRSLNRGTVGTNGMYFETGQGSALSAQAHHGVDQQTCEARAYAVAREFDPLLTNTVVGFIGPEYLYDGKQIIRAALEDHFCGKLLGVPMGCDVCYTNHAEADQDDMDTLLTALGAAGVSFVMGVPGADDILLNYQSTSFHDALYVRQVLGLRRAPEFEAWLERMGITDLQGRLSRLSEGQPLLTFARDLAELPKPIRQAPAQQSKWAQQDPWQELRRFTQARIALGRVGSSLPTQGVLEFGLAHARARDAVHAPFDRVGIMAQLAEAGFDGVAVDSAAADRQVYLHRPDLGRRLDAEGHARLDVMRRAEGADVVFVIADGLSAIAAFQHAVPLLQLMRVHLEGWRLGPVVVAQQARVALGDEIGQLLSAEQVVMLIGERPGLSAADSLGIYLTYAPCPGRTDAERNCISNVRVQGLSYEDAARTLFYLLSAARQLKLSGVGLKEGGVFLPSA